MVAAPLPRSRGGWGKRGRWGQLAWPGDRSRAAPHIVLRSCPAFIKWKTGPARFPPRGRSRISFLSCGETIGRIYCAVKSKPLLLGRFGFVVLHHEAAIAFLGVLSYGLFCQIKEAFRPLSVTPVQFTRHANWPFDRVAATLRESPGVVVEEFDLKSRWRFMHAAILPRLFGPASGGQSQARRYRNYRCWLR